MVLGQYRGYRDEPGVSKLSVMPTFAALRVWVDNWRWQGVPFYLRAGKKLERRVTEVALHMQPIPLSLFGRSDVCDHVDPNVLTLRIQPDEGIELQFASKIPGHDLMVGTVAMEMKYVEAFGGQPPEAYERLIYDAMNGEQTLFIRGDEAEAAWSVIDPIEQGWARSKNPPEQYAPGSWGPKNAMDLIERYERAAEKYGRRSGNQVAGEVLEQYLEFWEQAEEGRLAVISQQREVLRKEKPAPRSR